MLDTLQPVTSEGNILLHNQGATTITLRFADEAGAPRNMSARAIWFEASNGHRIVLTNGGTTDLKVLTIAQHILDDILNVVAGFVVVDETDALNVVEWQGDLLVTGWLG